MAGRSVGEVNAKLTLDTTQYSSANKAAQTEATATTRAIASAAQDQAKAQTTAARYATEKLTEESRKRRELIQQEAQARRDIISLEKSVTRGTIDEATGNDRIAAAMQRQLNLKREIFELSVAEEGLSKKQQSSAILRGGGLRAAENVFATFAPASLLAVGGLALGVTSLIGVFAEMGVKGYEAFQKVQHQAEATKAAFAELHDKAVISNDDLELHNQKIQDQIDKLSGHPNNGLATALLEAKKMSDQLIESLVESRKQQDALFKEQSTGPLGNVFSFLGLGPKSTGTQENNLREDEKDIGHRESKARDKYLLGMGSAKTDDDKKQVTERYTQDLSAPTLEHKALAIREKQRLQKEQDDREHAASLSRSTNTGASITIDNSAKIAQLDGVIGAYDERLTHIKAITSGFNLEQKLGQIKQDRANEPADNGNKAAEQLLRNFETQLKEQHLAAPTDLAWDEKFWAERIGQFKAGSSQYLAVLSKQDALAEEIVRKAHESVKKQQELELREDRENAAELLQVQRGLMEQQLKLGAEARERDRGRDTRNDMAAELGAVRSRNAAALEEQSLQREVGKTITSKAAALRRAELSAKAYGDELERLNAKAAQVAAASYLTEPEKQQQLGRLSIDAENLNGRRSIELDKQADEQSSPDTSAAVGAAAALDQLADAAKDSAGQMRELIGSVQGSVNDAIMAQGKRYARPREIWENAGHRVLQGVEGNLLNKAEGSLLSAFGFGKQGKPTGTSGDPLHVVVTNLPGLDVPGLTNTLKEGGSGMARTGLGWVQGLLGGILPGFATGGYVSGGTMAMVGENGPEPVFFGDEARVMTNSDMRSAIGGGSGGHSISVDARGSTDPAQTAALVKAGIVSMMPAIARASAEHYQSSNRRNGPSGRR